MTLAVDVGRVTTESCPPSTLPELKRVWGPCQPSVPTQGLGSSSRLCPPQGGLQTPALPTPCQGPGIVTSDWGDCDGPESLRETEATKGMWLL